MPSQVFSMVIFAHGSGSSRLSPRNRMVAGFLNEQGIGTFLFDLLTEREDQDRANRFDLLKLSERLEQAAVWLHKQDKLKDLPTGFFGASTGAAAALIAAELLPWIAAIVSRGGRPDLAMKSLPLVKASTLLIVGSLDQEVIRLNQQAYGHLSCEKKIEIVQGASHLFEEKGTMEKVCVLAANWFEMHLHPLELTR
jgi:predicted alpha/beta-hydrolase family hydrolase